MGELLRFSRGDIERLAEELNQILTKSELDDNQKRLLLAILEVASENAYQPVSTPADVEGKELRTQIARSFVRDDEREFAIYVTDFKIGVRPKKPPKK